MASDKRFVGPVNMDNPIEFNMIKLTEQILTLTGGKSKLQFCPLPIDDPKQLQPDISLAKEKLDWVPTVNLEDGLKEIVHYFRTLLSV